MKRLIRLNYCRDVALLLAIAASVVTMSASSEATHSKVRLSHIDLRSVISHGSNSETACPETADHCEYFGAFLIEKASWVACAQSKEFLGQKGCQFADAALGHSTSIGIVNQLIEEEDSDNKVLRGGATASQIKAALESCCVQKGQHIVLVKEANGNVCGPAYTLHDLTVEVTGYECNDKPCNNPTLYLTGTIVVEGAHLPYSVAEFCTHETIDTELMVDP
jgi:hypothetical protein